MSSKTEGLLTLADHALKLDLISKVQGLDVAENYFNRLRDEDKVEKTYGALLNCYFREVATNKSLSLLQKMKELGYASSSLMYNCEMCLYINIGQLEKVPDMLSEMKEANISPGNFSYRICLNSYVKSLWALRKAVHKRQSNKDFTTMLGSLVKLREIEEAEKLLHEWEVSCEFYNSHVPNTLVIGYCRKGWPEKAEKMLRGIIKQGKTRIPNSWSIVAAGHVDKDDTEKAFECMKEALALQSQSEAWQPKNEVVSIILNWVGVNRASEVESFLSSLNTVPCSDQKAVNLWETVSADGSNEDTMQEENL
ncbi:hypothetical protein BT93_L1095 [Corymbia citriodora subsp. variegata]|nr:hypothetical protein BT93_L1095 [Corymbia citriodora subsp. variegata]